MQDLCCESMIKYIKIIQVQLVEKRCAINNQTDGGYLTIYYSHRLFIACCVLCVCESQGTASEASYLFSRLLDGMVIVTIIFSQLSIRH